jgi:5'-3' exonuclease
MEKMAVYERYAQPITDSLVYEVVDYLKYKGLDFIVAPYEADSQMAYLYHSKKVDFIISEDSDMIAYDCYKIVKGLKTNGKCDVLDFDDPSNDLFNEDNRDIDEMEYFDRFLTLSYIIRP